MRISPSRKSVCHAARSAASNSEIMARLPSCVCVCDAVVHVVSTDFRGEDGPLRYGRSTRPQPNPNAQLRASTNALDRSAFPPNATETSFAPNRRKQYCRMLTPGFSSVSKKVKWLLCVNFAVARGVPGNATEIRHRTNIDDISEFASTASKANAKTLRMTSTSAFRPSGEGPRCAHTQTQDTRTI